MIAAVTWCLLLGSPPIVDRPIHAGPERARLMLEYRRRHEDPAATNLTIEPRVIVIHHTATPTMIAAFRAFNRATMSPERKELVRQGLVNVSAHFLVDRDGAIFRLMPETRMARHCIGLNHVAIGIENVGGLPGYPLTEAQLDANAALVADLAARHPISHLIGHFEARAMEPHPYFRERQAGYRTRKVDPDPSFLRALRKRVLRLGLRGPPG